MNSNQEFLTRGESAALPLVWVLTDDRPGNTTQSTGLARALGWPYIVKELRFTPLVRTVRKIFGPLAATRRALDRSGSDELDPPWPDIVIAAGWRAAQVSRWICRQNRGRTRTIQLGRKGGYVAGLFDIVISCGYFRLPSHPRRIEVTVPLTQVSPERLAEATKRWPALAESARRPYIMALIGGATKRYRWTNGIARRLGEDLRAFAQTTGGTIFAITSRRTGAETALALQEGLGKDARVHLWQPGRKDNPYLAYLALADIFIVTGESESMLAEAASIGKPLYIYPLPFIPPKKRKARLKDLIVSHAYSQGQEAQPPSVARLAVATLCRGLIRSGLIRPRRNLHEFHRSLERRGVAKFFDSGFQPWESPPLREIDDVAKKVKALLGYAPGGRTIA